METQKKEVTTQSPGCLSFGQATPFVIVVLTLVLTGIVALIRVIISPAAPEVPAPTWVEIPPPSLTVVVKDPMGKEVVKVQFVEVNLGPPQTNYFRVITGGNTQIQRVTTQEKMLGHPELGLDNQTLYGRLSMPSTYTTTLEESSQ